MSIFSNIWINNDLNSYGLSILLLNIINYLIVFMLILSVILLTNLSKFKSLNQFKEFNSYNFILYSLIFSLLSMAGIPPLLGFTGKFLAILYSSFKSQYLLILFMTILNIFGMYFYIQNLRFVVKKNKSSILNYKNYYVNINYSITLNIILLNFFNFFGILFLSDLIIILNYISSYIYI
uniref:NADH dehydrogenase subunit 2 n=1 Tax=Tetrahymena thermophila TaxID=5911 RepID=Q951B2_TETTH|nr:NADH dehydrogenase subunit 2 [Tetrahymena thermophila]7TGH_2B Chain 2B, NADH dehydrogenase subunit 2 [Tetrahymena thermophila]8B6F_BH Chain BH, NADH dehydrogenase subunit 2 [Tetrahymena thermophila SB210]8BQS_BH Chain BH, NADH dehydrogenase subunit 2 [Tetrahymena thermophila SB210]8GYM_2B Chain 2B, NADH dehydrogenase subunit 2 [Tetrahymena thermophila SB210]8GYM_2b Chain 2b, NADH dehydrogenase subunit 2 [Tetrahymena thermophila SB210]8GZU_2B Chain 2B, NADH dehydrogenase subunit 2 [Tetrahym